MNLQRITASPGDNDVDEIVLHGIDLHVERMSDDAIWFAAYREGTDDRLMFWFQAVKKGEARLSAYWDGKPWDDVRNEARTWLSSLDVTWDEDE